MNLFRHTFTRRARRLASHEISPEDVFLDSKNVSNMDMNQMEGHLERPLGRHVFYLAIGVLFILVGGFTARLFAMQIMDGGDFTADLPKGTPITQGETVYLRSNQVFVLGTVVSVQDDDQATGMRIFVRGAYNPADSSVFYMNTAYVR